MHIYIYIATYCQFIHGNAIIHGILLILANHSGIKYGEVVNGSFFSAMVSTTNFYYGGSPN